jgi:hypothetical protein
MALLRNAVPQGVRQVVRYRLARLSESSARVLTWAAFLPMRITLPELMAIAQASQADVLDALQAARLAGFVRAEAPLEWSFVHALVRRAVLDAQAAEHRPVMHLHVAQRLEGLTGIEPALIAGHYWAARGLLGSERGITWCERAAGEATRRGAHEFAVTALRMAAELAQPLDARARAQVLARSARAEAAALHFDASLETLAHAERALDELSESQPQRIELLTALVRSLREGGAESRMWEPLIRRGLALVPRGSLPWARLTLLHDPIETLIADDLRLGHWTGSALAACEVAAASGDEADIALANHPLDIRDHAATERLFNRARQSTSPASLPLLDACVRDYLYRHRDLPAAREALRDLLLRSEELGAVPTQAEALLQMAAATTFLGEYEAACESASHANNLIARLGP